MSYPRDMAAWDRVMRKLARQAARRAAVDAVREVYQIPDFLRRDAIERRAHQRGQQREQLGLFA